MNFNDFFGIRDAEAIFLMYRTGIRNSTMMFNRERHFDFTDNIVYLDGTIMITSLLIDLVKAYAKEGAILILYRKDYLNTPLNIILEILIHIV
ncbi:hypothetical protein AX762_02925 [Alkalibacterium sp. 20]|nr:hypothetical protein AX762_02925 [Alkalibacterium sp. 20]